MLGREVRRLGCCQLRGQRQGLFERAAQFGKAEIFLFFIKAELSFESFIGEFKYLDLRCRGGIKHCVRQPFFGAAAVERAFSA